ncbi:MAG: hypothetical protein HYT65_02485 [Candidatus Yanofskybacteria bacterium]|nr:hypothetical protein [Candidatus Yanofskybacteria bacterium]
MRLTRLFLLFFCFTTESPLFGQNGIVKAVYLIPTDRQYKVEYRNAIDSALKNLQQWYYRQMGDKTFHLSEPTVEVIRTPHEAGWYSTNPNIYEQQYIFWGNVDADINAVYSGGFWQDGKVLIFFIDADQDCLQFGFTGQGDGARGSAFMAADALRGLAGEPLIGCSHVSQRQSSVNFWTCMTGHELGHGFSLSHPPNGAGTSIMSPCGHELYPNISLLDEEKRILGESIFFKSARKDISLQAVVNGASFKPGLVAPGEIISLFGTGLAGYTVAAGTLPLPTELGDARVTINGENAPLYYVSPGQINAQVTSVQPGGIARIEVYDATGMFSSAKEIVVAPTAPGLFMYNGLAIVTLANGPNAGKLVNPENPAQSSVSCEFCIVSLWAAGLGRTELSVPAGQAPGEPTRTTARVEVFIDGIYAEIQYSGLHPYFTGLYQINFVVPPSLPSGQHMGELLVDGESITKFLIDTITQ